ncbi:unnamed protein product [Linum tenue]|uniref:Uncharacterized protein n=1 Tax=Linum tenue TaxID=586396 RepID=A0AAV0M650_9ROSI|nr:unnamed protein product [Linum tenue]
MGNCLFGGGGGEAIRVITSTGAILEFHFPITAGSLAGEFPGHAIFPSHDLFWTPLSLSDHLRPGHSYYLLPNPKLPPAGNPSSSLSSVKEGHVRSKSSPSSLTGLTPYRMSLDSNYHQGAMKRSHTEAFSLPSSVSGGKVRNQEEAGFWKVKLVIGTDQLLEILSHEGSTHDLVRNVSAVAKCGSGYSTALTSRSCSAAVSSSSSDSSSSASSVVGFSDDWIAAGVSSCTSSSRNGSAKKDRRSLVGVAVAS